METLTHQAIHQHHLAFDGHVTITHLPERRSQSPKTTLSTLILTTHRTDVIRANVRSIDSVTPHPQGTLLTLRATQPQARTVANRLISLTGCQLLEIRTTTH